MQKPSEEPYKNEVWPVLAAEEHPDAPPPKRLRVNRYTSAPLSRTRAMLPWGKRLTCTSETTPTDAKTRWQEVFSELESQIPRVGKRWIEDSELLSLVQQLVPDKLVVSMMACRGASRTIAPPAHILKGMAPLRRSIYTECGSGEIRPEEEWEQWEELTKRNLIRPSHAARINLTLFAKEWATQGLFQTAQILQVTTLPHRVSLMSRHRRLLRQGLLQERPKRISSKGSFL